MSPDFNPGATDRVTRAVDNGPRGWIARRGRDVETFHGYDFDTMTETAAPGAFSTVPCTLDFRHIEVEGDVSFMRGVLYGLLFTLPFWAAMAGALILIFN
jgi:hypothetical protein